MIVRAENLGVKYGEIWGIRDLTFKADTERLALIGHNGSGKTTLLSVLSGIMHPTTGRAEINGWEPYRRKDKWIAIRYSFEKPDFRVPIRVKDLVETLRANPLCSNIDEMIEAFEIDRFMEERLNSLSSGQAQLCNLLVALSCESEVLILDEPTAHLDSYRAGIVDDIISQKNGVIIATHDIEEGESIADYFLVLKEGQKVWEGDRKKLFSEGIYEVMLTDVKVNPQVETIYRFGSTLIVKASREEVVRMFLGGKLLGVKKAGLRYVYSKSR
ncbi:ABC transporter ATP-binding protein [Thermococcus sp.]|uniref:ATP-binding cassette domain-containing protein n=1 Tax=Thermococcus sp. TaxID=35749 RepID=UPI00261B7BE9|nr:ABC transporter ATP-binding protein [Thermococcus sp.]